ELAGKRLGCYPSGLKGVLFTVDLNLNVAASNLSHFLTPDYRSVFPSKLVHWKMLSATNAKSPTVKLRIASIGFCDRRRHYGGRATTRIKLCFGPELALHRVFLRPIFLVFDIPILTVRRLFCGRKVTEGMPRPNTHVDITVA